MMGLFPRLVTAVFCAAVVSFSVVSFSVPASAQGNEQKPAEQPSVQPGQPGQPADAAKNGQKAEKTDELAEAAKVLNGPAGNAECVWIGRRVVSLLWRDDLDTAFRHLDLYDRFSCPAAHIQATFRCVVAQGPFESKPPQEGNKPADGKQPENKAPDLNARVHSCWINPGPANPQDAPASTVGNPARR